MNHPAFRFSVAVIKRSFVLNLSPLDLWVCVFPAGWLSMHFRVFSIILGFCYLDVRKLSPPLSVTMQYYLRLPNGPRMIAAWFRYSGWSKIYHSCYGGSILVTSIYKQKKIRNALHTLSYWIFTITLCWSYPQNQLGKLGLWEVNHWSQPLSWVVAEPGLAVNRPDSKFLLHQVSLAHQYFRKPRSEVRKIRGTECQVLKDHPCWTWSAHCLQEMGRVSSFSWHLRTIIRANLSPVTMWRVFRCLTSPPTHGKVCRELSYLSELNQSQPFIKSASDSCIKMVDFSRPEKLVKELHTSLHLSRQFFLLFECFQMGKRN